MKTPYMKSLFRNVQREPRRFKHKSRFYDEKSEELQKRLDQVERQVKLEQGEDIEFTPRTFNFSKRTTAKSGVLKYSSQQKKSANLRLIVILVVLGAIAYYGITHIEVFLGK